MFDLVKLDSSLEPLFNRYVTHDDVPHYFHFILDWRMNRDDTEIWLALRKGEIHGMMLIYKRRVVQLRGEEPAVETLLDKVNLERIEFNAEIEHRRIIKDRYELAREGEILLMTLRKGEERLAPTENVVRLTPERANEIADLLKDAKPEAWGDLNGEEVAASMEKRLWLGIIADGVLVTVGATLLTDPVSNIGKVATHASYRNRGYATSVVSALVKEIMQRNDMALIHVQKDNLPALRAYGKVCFQVYRNYFCGITG